jgi:hypothetical protein
MKIGRATGQDPLSAARWRADIRAQGNFSVLNEHLIQPDKLAEAEVERAIQHHLAAVNLLLFLLFVAAGLMAALPAAMPDLGALLIEEPLLKWGVLVLPVLLWLLIFPVALSESGMAGMAFLLLFAVCLGLGASTAVRLGLPSVNSFAAARVLVLASLPFLVLAPLRFPAGETLPRVLAFGVSGLAGVLTALAVHALGLGRLGVEFLICVGLQLFLAALSGWALPRLSRDFAEKFQSRRSRLKLAVDAALGFFQDILLFIVHVLRGLPRNRTSRGFN